MVYLEHPTGKFWRCTKTSAKTVTISYGKLGMAGRTMKKSDFKNGAEAETYVEKQEATKRKGGYEDAVDPEDKGKKGKKGGKKATTAKAPAKAPAKTTKATGKRKAAATTATAAPSPTKKAGLSGHAAPSLEDDGDDGTAEMDSGVAGVDSALASRAAVHDTLHAKLALVDPAKNHDKYYVLQVLADDGAKKPKGRGRKKASGPQYYLFTRWGRTGTGGQAKLDGPHADLETAEDEFAKAFKSKTGVSWDAAVPGAPPKRGKYEYLAKSSRPASDAGWFYYLQNDPLGKKDGWYPYDEGNRDEAEELHSEFAASGNASRLSTRLVHSESSGFAYRVDLSAMTQTNTQSGTSRPIRRTADGKKPGGKPAAKKAAKAAAKSSPAATPTPLKAVKAKSPAAKSAPSAVRSLAKPMSKVTAGEVDPAASGKLSSGSIYGDYDCMLNQTNLRANNNKFYKIQLVETSGGVYLFTKWGRVGEAGATQEAGPLDSDKAEKEFCKKFKAKTGNNWEDREEFVAKKGKYKLVEIERDAEAAEAMTTCSSTAAGKKVKILPSELDSKTKAFVDLIFNEDMFKSAMSSMNLDPQKLPLGALSSNQIQRGFEALEAIEEELDGRARSNKLMELTSDFYTVIPHSFGRSRGPVLNTKQMVKEKYDMLNTLTDIEAAQDMQKRNRRAAAAKKEEEAVEHPSDLNYKQLCADLTLMEEDDDERPVLEKFLADTKAKSSYQDMTLRDIWRVNRHKEDERFSAHESLTNRKLLWHGTGVAVVAAIMKSGLRIMPHSGGRVGRGIYLADQHQKSAWYVSPARGTIVMFLVEAALGKEKGILRDDHTLTAAPKGYDSVLARGTHAPPDFEEIEIDGNKVSVPQGKPKEVAGAKGSSFAHNEFLIYKESQHRIRYVLAFDSK